MSGGSMNYLYSRIESADFRASTPERIAFRDHLIKVAQALHDIEWVDSGDYCEGRENAAIMACIGPGATLEAALKAAESARMDLEAEIVRAMELQNGGKA